MNWATLLRARIRSLLLAPLLGVGVLSALLAPTLQGSESWHVTPGAGLFLFPGGDASRNSWVGTWRAGYDMNAPLSLEIGGLAGGVARPADAVDSGVRDLMGTWLDLIVHLRRWERLDPFLSAGGGAFWCDGRGLPDNRQEAVYPRAGAGFLYSLSENWSFRLGATLLVAGSREACGGVVEAGFSYYFGDTTPERPPMAE